MHYLKLIRPFNLLMIVLVQLLIYFALFQKLSIPTQLDGIHYIILIFATLCIAASGNVINDIYDQKIDKINRPESLIVGNVISEKAAYNYYIILTILGVGSGFYLANHVGYPGLSGVFIVCSALLYIYATQINTMLIWGNLLISLLVAMSLIIVILFDIFPAIEAATRTVQIKIAGVILLYAGFAFFINLIREIAKDLQDIDGDRNGGRNTLPILLGRQRTTNVVFVLGVVALVCVLGYTYQVLYKYPVVAFYFVFLIAAPLVYFCIRAWNATTNKHFKQLSNILKAVMVLGICSLMVYARILQGV